MASFLESFFGAGGTGSSLVNAGASIGLSAVQNKGKDITGRYAIELQKLTNDRDLSEDQFKIELTKLNQQFAVVKASSDDEKRNDTLQLVAVAGSLLVVITIAVVLILRRNPPARKPARSSVTGQKT